MANTNSTTITTNNKLNYIPYTCFFIGLSGISSLIGAVSLKHYKNKRKQITEKDFGDGELFEKYSYRENTSKKIFYGGMILAGLTSIYSLTRSHISRNSN